MICSKHKTTMTYRDGKGNELFYKKCEKKRLVNNKKKPWWKFW